MKLKKTIRIEVTDEETGDKITVIRQMSYDDSIFSRHNAEKLGVVYGDLNIINQPSIIQSDNSKFYYKNNKLHRTNGPAADTENEKTWCVNGQKHRIGGPAIINTEKNILQWWLAGHSCPYNNYYDYMDEEIQVKLKLEYES